MYRQKDKQIEYRAATHKGREENYCPFCNEEEDLTVFEGENFIIRKNKFSYDIWDSHEVEDHLLLMPREHLIDLNKFNDEMRLEYLKIVEKYMEQGYDSFTRSTQSGVRSQPHVHTHLIKTQGERVKSFVLDSELGSVEYGW